MERAFATDPAFDVRLISDREVQIRQVLGEQREQPPYLVVVTNSPNEPESHIPIRGISCTMAPGEDAGTP